jgi:hypothetical protein
MEGEPLHVSIDGDRIVLKGRLENSSETVRILKSELSGLPRYGRSPEFLILATDLRIAREGEKAWICAVKKYLRKYRLVYAPSQLSMLVEFEDDYDHQDSVFEECSDSHSERFTHSMVEHVA